MTERKKERGRKKKDIRKKSSARIHTPSNNNTKLLAIKAAKIPRSVQRWLNSKPSGR